MAKMGRPRIEIDPKELKQLARLQCTMKEVAAFFGCSVDTIERRFNEDEELRQIWEDGKGMGMISLRRKQFQILEEKNDTTMAIWLGKNILGQRDKVELDVEIEAGDGLAEAFGLIDQLVKGKAE